MHKPSENLKKKKLKSNIFTIEKLCDINCDNLNFQKKELPQLKVTNKSCSHKKWLDMSL